MFIVTKDTFDNLKKVILPMSNRFRTYSFSGITLILCFYPTLLFAQGWGWQNPQPFGDSIRNIFFLDDQYGWMMPSNNTLLRTINGGANWEILYEGIVFNDMHFVTPNEGWGIGRLEQWRSSNSIYHTTNGGESWSLQLPDTSVRYDIFFLDSQTGWASGDGGTLVKTSDGGTSWEFLNVGTVFDMLQGVYFKDLLNGWAVGGFQSGYRTRDGGATWTEEVLLDNICYFAQSDSLHIWGLSNFWEIVRSSNGGETWERSNFAPPGNAYGTDIQAINNQIVYVSTIGGLYKSSDGGTSWTQNSSQRLSSLHFTNIDEGWGAGNPSYGEMLYTSDSGETWTNLIETNNPSGFSSYRAVDFIDSQTGWIAGSINSNALLKTTDGGESFFEQDCNTDDSLLDVAFIDSQTGWVVGREGIICHTDDGGTTWVEQNSGTDYSLNSVQLLNSQQGWIVGDDFTDGVILRTSDGGAAWSDVAPIGLGASFRDVWFINASIGWVVGGGGNAFDKGVILKTSDAGLTWEVQREHPGMELGLVQFMDSLVGYAAGYDPASDSGILFTEDGGQNWLPRGKPTYPSGMVFLNKDTGWICDWGSQIFRTDDGGISWNEQTTYTSQNLFDIDFIDSNTGWVVGDFGTIMKTSSGGITGIRQTDRRRELNRSFILFPNYPNPFNPSTKINFEILEDNVDVHIEIFDLNGRKIKTLLQSRLAKRMHAIKWNGRDTHGFEVSSGIYFYRIRGNDNFVVSKMIKIN